jgi:hypothetical protein
MQPLPCANAPTLSLTLPARSSITAPRSSHNL